MRRISLIIILFLAACGKQEPPLLFDKNYATPCEAFSDISKYALQIHVDKDVDQYSEIRAGASKKLAEKLNFTGSIPPTSECEDIETYASTQTKKNKMQVYSDALQYFMQEMDPHSLYIPETGAIDMKKQEKNIAYGIGIEPKYIHRAIRFAMPIDTIMLDFVYPDTPAFGKLRAEDQIQTINGQEIKGMTFLDVATIIAADKKKLEVKVKRLDDPITFLQGDFHKPTMYIKPIEKEGHNYDLIRISRFVDGVSKELKKNLEKLNQQNNDGLILDLRGNPGGLVNEGVSVLEMLVPSGGEVFHTEGSNKENAVSKEFRRKTYGVNGKAFFRKPIVVLVDSDTASIAEAVAGTLKNKHRAVVIGNKTFGKGSVQVDQSVSTKNGFGGILITTVSLLYYPNEDTHQLKGVLPNYLFEDKRCDSAISIVKERVSTSIFYEKDYANTIKPHTSSSVKVSSDLSGEDMSDVGDVGTSFTHTCDNVNYQACLETYATRFLELLNNKNAI